MALPPSKNRPRLPLVLKPADPSPVIPLPSGTVPYVIMKVYYKHGESHIIICTDDTTFLEAVNAHVAELQAHEPSYTLKTNSATPEYWLYDLLKSSKEIMNDEQGGYAWVAVVHGSSVYAINDYEVLK